MAFPAVIAIFACVPQLIMNYFFLWQFFTGQLVHMNFLDMLFALLSYMFTACQIEKEIGTLRMIYRFFVLGAICLLTFTIICAAAGI